MIVQVKHWALLAAAVASAGALAQTAQAQARRVQAPPPPQPPSVQKPTVDPTSQAISALALKLDALQQDLGRQVVALHFPPTGPTSWPDDQNSFPENNQRAESMCKAALGDRYGRVVFRQALPTGDRWYFPNLLCETAP